MRAHERIHSDARPYACRRCHKAFKTSECLWHHENRSKSCGGVAQQQQQQQQVPVVDDAVRSRGRKRGRRHAELLPGVSASSDCLPLSCTAPVPTATGIGTNTAKLGGFPALQIPALPLVSSGLSASRASTSICTVNSISAPLTSSLSDCTGNSVVQIPLSSRFDATNVGRTVTAGERALTTGSSHREGLVLLANCAVSGPTDVTAPTQVKVEPEVVLADYELTAMNTPEASFYERKRMAADETTSATQHPSSLTDLHLTPPVTGSRSPEKDGGPMMSVSGRIECRECGRQFASLVAYNKHSLIHRSISISQLF